jgi:hypothetical protein
VTLANITQTGSAGQGAYGLRLDGLSTSLLVSPVPDNWKVIKVTQDTDTPPSERSIYSEDAIDMSFEEGWGVSLRRDSATMTFQLPRRIPDDELVHPMLSPAAMQFAAWIGHSTFHGGAFVQEGRAFAVLARRTGGKSTTLARLASRGVPVLVDDLLVIDKEQNVLAGPRCIDLRRESVTDDSLEASRGDERRRMRLPPIDPSYPLVGVFVLGWGDDIAIHKLAPAERVVALTKHCRAEVAGTSALLELSRLPVWRVGRRHDLAALDDVCSRLLDTALDGIEPGSLKR